MFRSTSRRLATVAAAAAASGVIALTGAGAAAALASGSYPEAPGQGNCVSQYASFAVRADGWATGDGAKFKLLYNGSVIDNSPVRVTSFAAERRAAWGTFPGSGLYSLCAQNTGTRNTIATLQLKTDYEV